MTEKKAAIIERLADRDYSDSMVVVRFLVDGVDEFRYLIDKAFVAEASPYHKKTVRRYFNYIKSCPGRCKKNGVEIEHPYVPEKNNDDDEVSDE